MLNWVVCYYYGNIELNFKIIEIHTCTYECIEFDCECVDYIWHEKKYTGNNNSFLDASKNYTTSVLMNKSLIFSRWRATTVVVWLAGRPLIVMWTLTNACRLRVSMAPPV